MLLLGLRFGRGRTGLGSSLKGRGLARFMSWRLGVGDDLGGAESVPGVGEIVAGLIRAKGDDGTWQGR
jgi:hypothetical protein